MTEIQFDIVDELYFVTSFEALAETLSLPENALKAELWQLVKQGFVKSFFPDADNEVSFSETEFEEKCSQCLFLATKAGLLAHNSR